MTFSLRLPDFTTSFHAEHLAISLALRKLHSATQHAIVLTDSLSVCTALSCSKYSPLRRALGYLLPLSLQKLRLVWVPGHAGIWLNEAADSGGHCIGWPGDGGSTAHKFCQLGTLSKIRPATKHG